MAKHRRHETEPDPEVLPWEEWASPRNWGPPPVLHPDHPSAPVRRVRLPAEGRPGPASAAGGYDPLELAHQQSRDPGLSPGTPLRPMGVGYPAGSSRLHLVLAGYRGEAIPPEAGPGPGPAPRRFPNGRSPRTDPLWTAGQVLTIADDRADQITREAQRYAAAIREAAEHEAAAFLPPPEQEAAAIRQAAEQEAAAFLSAAERDAAAIREAAEQEATAMREAAEDVAAAIRGAAEDDAAAMREAADDAAASHEARERDAADLQARLESISGELSRVAAYVADSLAGTATATGGPALGAPVASPAPGPRDTALPEAPAAAAPPHAPPPRSAMRREKAAPDVYTRPAPDNRTGPSRPGMNRQRQPRQAHAMRVATYAFSGLLAFALLTAGTEASLHGFKFFVFRGGGVGVSAGSETDQQFLAAEAAAGHPAAHHHPAAPAADIAAKRPTAHHPAAPKVHHKKAHH